MLTPPLNLLIRHYSTLYRPDTHTRYHTQTMHKYACVLHVGCMYVFVCMVWTCIADGLVSIQVVHGLHQSRFM